MNILLFFIDGFGIGEDIPGKNPFISANIPTLENLFQGIDSIMIPTDTTLGTSGLPQSATGQTALLTGKNAAQEMGGRHKSGFPGPTLKRLIKKGSLFSQLKAVGKKVTFANAYNDQSLQRLAKGLQKGSVTTTVVYYSGVEYRTIEQIKEGKAVYQEYTNRLLRERGYDLPVFTPEEAADNLVNIVRENDLTLYEYFQTDIVGHSQDFGRAVKLLEDLDRFIAQLIRNLDLRRTLIIITSDHGNIEDLSVRTHTRNRVPTILVGAGKEKIRGEINEITDITPAIIKLINLQGQEDERC